MKRFILFLFILFFCTTVFASDLLNEGFDQAGNFPPTGWDVQTTNTGVSYGGKPLTWAQASGTTDPHSPPYSAKVYGAMFYEGEQDEFLITPQLDLSGYTSAAVTFWSAGFGIDSVDTGTTITLSISTDAAKTDWITIWTYPEPEWTTGYEWHEKELDLSEYTGETIWLGWRYTYDAVSYDWAYNYYLDDVTITGALLSDDDDDATGDDDVSDDDDDDDNDNDPGTKSDGNDSGGDNCG